jgi:hypothetical protein
MYDIRLLLEYMQHFLNSHIISPTDLLYPSPAPHFRPFQVFMTHFAKFPISVPYKAMLQM